MAKIIKIRMDINMKTANDNPIYRHYSCRPGADNYDNGILGGQNENQNHYDSR